MKPFSAAWNKKFERLSAEYGKMVVELLIASEARKWPNGEKFLTNEALKELRFLSKKVAK